jgi:nitrate reductase delta subunit
VKAQRRDEAFAVVRQAAAVCLGYPERDIVARSGLVRAALAEKAPEQVEAFEPLLAYWDTSDLRTIQIHYVDVFDLNRKHSLYLSYWTDGDTRRRGEVLAAFKRRYRRSGFLVDTGGAARLPADGAGVRGDRGSCRWHGAAPGISTQH